jgi:hypothetical protein
VNKSFEKIKTFELIVKNLRLLVESKIQLLPCDPLYGIPFTRERLGNLEIPDTRFWNPLWQSRCHISVPENFSLLCFVAKSRFTLEEAFDFASQIYSKRFVPLGSFGLVLAAEMPAAFPYGSWIVSLPHKGEEPVFDEMNPVRRDLAQIVTARRTIENGLRLQMNCWGYHFFPGDIIIVPILL